LGTFVGQARWRISPQRVYPLGAALAIDNRLSGVDAHRAGHHPPAGLLFCNVGHCPVRSCTIAASIIKGDGSGMKILVVEDEQKTGDYLRQGLMEAGFVVDLARDGVDGLHGALSQDYDLAILDVMLPGVDGWQVLRGIRRAGQDMPVLFLSARDDVQDRVKGLELGADDYLVKPFAFSELLARVRTLLRRGAKAREADCLRAADLELDLLRRRASRAGQRINLTSKEFALLELLLRRQGEVLPRSLIASQVWDMNFDSDTNVIDVAIRRLRVKVDDAFEQKLIHTVRGMGYVLEAGG
jgi:two-component system, OmpR family, copper resistance phosphate regulon response regulator CusR